jgi:putative salt-induced outer membrane protein
VVVRASSIAFFVCSLLTSAAADQITLKNGDRITGSISSSDTSTLVINTEYAGELAVKWDAVESIRSDQSLFVTTTNGQVLRGTVSAEGGKLEVSTKDLGAVTVARDAVTTIRSEEAQRAYGAWSGYADSGLSLSRGNSETTNFTLGAAATRATERDKLGAYVSSLWAKTSTAGVDLTTASAIHGGLRYDFNLSARTTAFAFTDFDHDRFQQLDLRNVIGGGLGYQLFKTERTIFDIFGGASLNQEFFTTLTRRSAELLAGQELNHKLTDTFSIRERLAVFPNVTDFGEHRLVFDLGAVTKINDFLSWQVTLSDRYISNPLPGLRGNDLLLTTGIRVAFGPANKL